jgi:hypothetical protein
MKSYKKLEAMVDDLIRKYPQGADNSLCKDDYEIDQVWTAHTNDYYNVAVTQGELCRLFNYSVDDYAQLWFVSNEVHDGLRSYLSRLYPDAGKRKISRRFNLLSYRLRRGMDRWQKKEGPATWKVDTDYPFPVYVIAGNRNGAEMLAKTMLSSNGIIPAYMYPKRYAPGDTETLSFLTEKLNVQVESQIEYTERSLNKIKERLESYKSLSESLSSMGTAQLDFLESQQ